MGDPASDVQILVVGDSHAVQWLPALRVIAERRGWRIQSFTKSACTFSDVVVLDPHGNSYESCAAWNERMLAVIARVRPDVVLVSQSRAANVAGVSDEQNAAAMAAGLSRQWQRVLRVGARLVVLADTPRPGIDVPECLSRRDGTIASCSRSAASSLAVQDPLLMGAEQQKLPVIDMNDVICPAGVCSPVIGSVLVWRDSTHLTATFVRTLAPTLENRLARAMQSPLKPAER